MKIAKDILEPSRIDSLESQSIRVIVHTAQDRAETHTIENVYAFQTLYALKQRIMMTMNAKEWAPEYVFVALADADGKFKPVEFRWEFAPLMDDPYSNLGLVREELYKDDVIEPETAEFFQGLLLKNVIGDAKEVHIWSAAQLFVALRRPESNPILYGYFRFYFPMLEFHESKLLGALKEVDDEKADWFDEMMESTSSYFAMMNERLAKLNEKLPSLPKRPCELFTLRKLRFDLPKKQKYARGLLEHHFYDMKASSQTPFIRFFPSSPSLSPLVKMAAGTLKKKDVFESYMSDKMRYDGDSDEKYSLILIKSQPIKNTDNVCWTIAIYDTGVAELIIEESRVNRSLNNQQVRDAFAVLPEFLGATVWSADAAKLEITKLNAQYVMKVDKEGDKPKQSELNKRYDVLIPLFRKEMFVPKSFTLRYKAVDNFVIDQDPIMEYITFAYLSSQSQADESADLAFIHSSLVKDFGLSTRKAIAYTELWKSTKSETIIRERKTEIVKYNSGTLITVINDHPEYKFDCTDIQSKQDLQYILSCMSLFVYNTSAELGMSKTPQAKAVELAEEQQEQQQEQREPDHEETEEEREMRLLMEQIAQDEQEVDVQAENAAVGEPEAITRVEKEIIPDINKEASLLTKLQSRDSDLFMTASKYASSCQASSHRQPNVMDAITYKKARRLYGDDVFWVEAPLSDYDVEAMKVVSKSVKERLKGENDHKQVVYKFEDIVAFEKRALQLGLYLKEEESKDKEKKGSLPVGRSVLTEAKKDVLDKYLETHPNAIQEMNELIEAQKKKPLWTVIRAGTKYAPPKPPNYYVCSEYWCLREGIPLIAEEFRGTMYRRGPGQFEPGKEENTCPFCGGGLIKRRKTAQTSYEYYNDEGGATVIQRLSKEKLALFPGYLKHVKHIDGYAQPCCFFDYTTLEFPDGTNKDVSNPPPAVELPAAQRQVKAHALPARAQVVDEKMIVNEDRERPFSPVKLKSNEKNRWYVCKQSVLGRSSIDRWFDIKRGHIAVPPKQVNELLGQDPDVFLTKTKGALGEGQNSKLMMPGHAFIRLGLDESVHTPGENMLNFLAYANYAIDYLFTANDDLMIQSNEDIAAMFDEKETLLFNAFIQGNYGTLLHEFTVPGQSLEDTMKFDRWREDVGLTGPSQRAYAVQAYLAWNNFKNYMRDVKIQKDLRLLETLFTCQGLFSKTGFVLVKIKWNESGPSVVECPKFGVSLYSQKVKPPAIFVLENAQTGLFEPLVFYEGRLGGADGKTEIRTLFGAIEPYSPQFNALSEPVQTVLRSFYNQYYGGADGCGRTAEPVHPWVQVVNPKDPLLPRLSELNNLEEIMTAKKGDKRKKGDKDGDAEAEAAEDKKTGSDYSSVIKLVRDRSNRLVGAILKQKPFKTSNEFYIPCVDDGCVLMDVPSVFGEEALPLSPVDAVISFLVGKQYKLSPNRIAHHFPGLRPQSIVFNDTQFVGVKLACQAIIPIAPVSMEHKIQIAYAIPERDASDPKHKKPTQFEMISELPWEMDIALLGPADPDAETVDSTDEEVLDEAYEHVRISLSNWLDTREGAAMKKQIELLRQARKRLPMYELQKRLDILLYPFVNTVVTSEGSASPSILRRDCLQIENEKDCTGSCTFSEGRCLIHAKGTKRYVDSKRVITARLTDELLRTFRKAEEILEQRVSMLRTLPSSTIVHEGDTLLFSATGRGDKSLYSQLGYTDQDTSQYKADLTYPEEVSVDGQGDVQPDREQRFAANIQHDPLARLTALWPTLTGTQEPIPQAFRGTDAQWKDYAMRFGIDVLKTRMGRDKVPVVDKRIKGSYNGAGDHSFILLDLEGVPQPILTAPIVKYIVSERELPGELKKIARDLLDDEN